MTYRRSGPEFTAGEVHVFGLFRIERHAVCHTAAHHLVDGLGSRNSRFIYCVAYGQDSRVIDIAKAAQGVAQPVDGFGIEQEKNRRYRRPLREAALERKGGCEGILISDTGRSASHKGYIPSSKTIDPAFAETQDHPAAHDGVKGISNVHHDQDCHLHVRERHFYNIDQGSH